MTRIERAIELRDAALAGMKSRGGTWQDAGPVKILLCEMADHLRVGYRGRFQKLPAIAARLKYRAVQLGCATPQNLPYDVDVWNDNRKVLCIKWDDNGHVELFSFSRGDWEQKLISACPAAVSVVAERQDKITIYGSKDNGTYIVEFRTAEGEALAISVPRTETAVLRQFQARMPYGLVVPDVQEPDIPNR